jgi:hypothetical protein
VDEQATERHALWPAVLMRLIPVLPGDAYPWASPDAVRGPGEANVRPPPAARAACGGAGRLPSGSETDVGALTLIRPARVSRGWVSQDSEVDYVD